MRRIETDAARYIDTIARFFKVDHRVALGFLSPIERECAKVEIMLAVRPVRVIVTRITAAISPYATLTIWEAEEETLDAELLSAVGEVV